MNNNIAKPYIKEFTRKNKLPIVILVIKAILDVGQSILGSWIIMQMTNLIAGVDNGLTLLDVVYVALIGLGVCFIMYVLDYFSRPKFTTKAMKQYTNYSFNRLTQKSVSAFTKEKSSLYISALSNDTSIIEMNYITSIINVFQYALVFIAAIIMMLVYSPLLTLISLLLGCLPLIVSLLTGKKAVYWQKKVSDENQKYIASLQDTINGFSVVKGFKAEDAMNKIFAEKMDKVSNVKEKKKKIDVIIEMLLSYAGMILQLGIFFIGGYFVIYKHSIEAGTVILFVQLLNYVIMAIKYVPNGIVNIKSSKALINKLANSLNENVVDQKGLEVSNIKNISINNLSYSYDEENNALSDVNLNFEDGKSYAIVGASGSGKSTLLGILEGMDMNYNGSILYDGLELKDINLDSLYKYISIIQQKVFIFDASIKDNITLFKDFDEEDINNAISLSGLKALVEAKGLDYLCGENGANLSGGEKQRISIARSLLQKSKLLLCDEITASLDNETAYQVSNAILDLKDITKIVVTHSLNEKTLKKYDKIIVMKDGHILEKGTFDELMKNKE